VPFARHELAVFLPRRTGKAYHVGELAREYGFTDIDGRRVPPFCIRETFVDMVKRFSKQNPVKG